MTDSRIQQALALHRNRQYDGAERLYREVLATDPRHFDALHMLGVLDYSKGETDAAARCCARQLPSGPTSRRPT